MNKKALTAVSAILASMFVSCGCSAKKAKYTNSQWSAEIISRYVESGIGDSAENIKDYTKKITRMDFAKLAYDYLKYYGYISPDANTESSFDDVNSPIPGILAGLGVINGKTPTEFAPDSLITREEAAQILYNICKLAGLKDVYETRLLSSYMYIDEEDMSDGAVDAIYNVTFHDVMNGTGDDKFSPKENLTVEQAIASLSRLFDILPNVKNDDFADILNANADKSSNYILSPLSAKIALALAANGAEGETRDEIIKAAGINDLIAFNKKTEKLIDKYSKSDIINLNISNSVWINNGNNSMSFSKGYKKLVSEYYNATAESVTNDNALEKINGWVNKNTNGIIDKIIDSTNFDSALINAIYFKAAWINHFEKSDTQKAEFNERSGKKTETDFMNSTEYFKNADCDGVKVVELAYTDCADVFDKDGGYIHTDVLKDADIGMYVLMPEEDKEINPCEIISKCKKENKFAYTELDLYIPKFKIEYSKELNDTLQSAGIKKAFTDSAEFSPMFDDGSMKIDKVLQKAYINIDEDGTEAAAVTAVIMATEGVFEPSDPEVVRFDKPFTFVIMDNGTNEALFVGEYAFVE